MTRDEWLEQRKRYITASDVAAMLGESPWKTREQLRMEKAGLVDEWAGDESSDIALALEPAVLQLARDRFGWSLSHNQDLVPDALCPRLAATPDAYMESPWGRAVVQVKVTRSQPTSSCKALKSGKPSTAAFAGGPPLYYLLQVQAEMACAGVDHGALLVLHTGPLKLRSYYIPRHDLVIAKIRSEAISIWKEIGVMK